MIEQQEHAERPDGTHCVKRSGAIVPPVELSGIQRETEFTDLRALLRKWRTADRVDGLPLYEDLVLGGLGRIAGDIAVIRCLEGDEARLLRAGPRFEALMQVPCRGTPLSGLGDAYQPSIRHALRTARGKLAPDLQLCRSCLDGMIATIELVVLPLSSRWAGEFYLVFARARSRQIELANLLVNSMHEGVMALSVLEQQDGIPEDFLILTINEAAAKLLDSDAATLRDTRISEVLKGGGLEHCMDDLRQAYLRGGATNTIECESNGTSLQVGITVVDSLLTVSFTDVGDLKARETLFRSMFDNNPVPMILRSHDGHRFLRANDAALSLYGYRREQLLTLEPGALVHAGDEPASRPTAGAGTGGVSRLHVRADGNALHVIEYEQLISVDSQPARLATIVDVTERTRAEARITYMAHHDPLTGIANRAVFTQALEKALDRLAETAGIAVISVDLDGFKLVNDTLGHDAGDRILTGVARRLLALTDKPDIVARLGGDEFALIIHDCPTGEAASARADRLKEVLNRPHRINGREVRIGASMGIALAPHHSRDMQQLMKCADLALYRAKRDTGTSHRLFEEQMDLLVSERRQLEMDLRRAVVEHEFELHYQPILSVKTGTLRGFEALMRWNHPERGMVSPAVFIALAEEMGVIDALGGWAIGKACSEAVGWPDDLIVAVNVSAAQFSGGNLIHAVDAALRETGLPPERLEIEVTESVLLHGSEDNLAVLHELDNRRVRVALDDFGTGYSSMGYLTKFPFSRIKIDRSFVAELEQNAASRAIVRAIIELASGFGMNITAEGVETVRQLEVLRQERCSELQGFLFSPPLAPDNLETLIDAYRGERISIRDAGFVAVRQPAPGDPRAIRAAMPATLE